MGATWSQALATRIWAMPTGEEIEGPEKEERQGKKQISKTAKACQSILVA